MLRLLLTVSVVCAPAIASAQLWCFQVTGGGVSGSGCTQVGGTVCKANKDICEQAQLAQIHLCGCDHFSANCTGGPITVSPCLPQGGPSGGGSSEPGLVAPTLDCDALGRPCGPADSIRVEQVRVGEAEGKLAALFEGKKAPARPRLVSSERFFATFAEGAERRSQEYVRHQRCLAESEEVEQALAAAEKSAEEIKGVLPQIYLWEPVSKLIDQGEAAGVNLMTGRAGGELAKPRLSKRVRQMKLAGDKRWAAALKEFNDAVKGTESCLSRPTCDLFKELAVVNFALKKFLEKIGGDPLKGALDRASKAGNRYSKLAGDMMKRNERLMSHAARCLGSP